MESREAAHGAGSLFLPNKLLSQRPEAGMGEEGKEEGNTNYLSSRRPLVHRVSGYRHLGTAEAQWREGERPGSMNPADGRGRGAGVLGWAADSVM